MSTVKLLSDEDVRKSPEAWAVFEDIRATRKIGFRQQLLARAGQ